MRRNANPGAGQAEARPQGGGSKGILLVIVLLGLAGGGYYVWRRYSRTGELVGMDAEESKELAERAKVLAETAREKATEAAKEGATKARDLLAQGGELLAKQKAGLEAWFEERDIALPTREDLARTARRHMKKFRDDDKRGEAAEPEEAGAEADPFVLGDREFRRGSEHWRDARPGSPDEQEKLGTARKHFTRAREHFQKAKELRPDDAKIDELVADCNRFIYDCMKRTVLDED